MSLEPTFCTFRKTDALVARIAVDMSAPTVPVRVFNLCDESITIHTNSTMGILNPIDQVKYFESEKGAVNRVTHEWGGRATPETPKEVPEHLTEF